MDTTQILLVVVATVLTVLLAVIGVQVVFILIEIKKSLQKVNQMIDHASVVTGGISKSLSGMGGLVEGIKTGLSIVKIFEKKKEKETNLS